MIVQRFYEDADILHDNTMAPRAYYIPASCRMDCLIEQREKSDRIQMLNGTWKFRYFDSIYEAQEPFFEEGYDVTGFDEHKVPGTWQMEGYDSHQYTNFRYPFPFDPPYVPQDNPCGEYVCRFEYKKEKDAPGVYLNFEGVDACFYVWINGIYIGYSQVSHATSEFDVTGVVRCGNNTLSVLVLKWCDGSYLEDQDKFRMSGIFRDVYLLKRPKRAVWDYRVTTVVYERKADVRIFVSYIGGTAALSATLCDQNGLEVDSKSVCAGSVSLEVCDPKLWNPEQPYLYTLILQTPYETITEYVGIRTVEIKNSIVYLNGNKIKFRGVNRHDFDPVTGCTVATEQVKNDLALMKRHNFNAIRSSHYPNAPYFYQMCDKYGFLVIAEADIEAHGPMGFYYSLNTDNNKFHHWNEQIADNPAWEKPILDRVQLMVQREKNRPCIVIWSVGNESAYGCNFEKALKWVKEYDPGRITHYESARYRNYDAQYQFEDLDLYSRMYPSLEEIKEYLARDAGKPLLLVEYCHSMGNGPGDLEDYFWLIQKNDAMCGGFVWEWCDHAIDCGRDKNGKIRYRYGGDFGEIVHDWNFCVDGLVYPDRTPHTGLLEYKNVYRPARVVSFDQNTKELKLHNYMDFLDLKDYAAIRYEVSCDGVCVQSGEVAAVSIKPHSESTAALDITIPPRGKAYLKIIYQLRNKSSFVPAGYELGFDEIRLSNEDGRNQTALKWMNRSTSDAAGIYVMETDDAVICGGRGFTHTFDKKTGLFSSVNYAGREYLTRPMELNIWRAPTDNDMYQKREWKRACYHEAYARAYDTSVLQTKDAVAIRTVLSVLAPSVQRILKAEVTWGIDCSGGIRSDFQVHRNVELPKLPRFGVRLFLNEKLEQVCYYGLGPMESYCDKHRAASHGIYRMRVDQMHEDYIRPQENGSHYDCDYVEVSGNRFGLFAASENTFSFQASVYSQEELTRAPHRDCLVKAGSTILCIDYAMSGIGSNSCGPKVLEKYRLDESEFAFAFQLIPYVKG